MNEFAKPNLAVSQIPSSSVADAGKALVVGEDGVPVWGNGGGSGGLPPYTSADLGKVLKIGNNSVHVDTYTTIEEQTVETNSNRRGFVSVDYSKWEVGRTVHFTVNGETVDCTISDVDVFGFQAEFSFGTVQVKHVVSSDIENFTAPGPATYTVSATVDVETPVASPGWAASGGGGGVLVCQIGDGGALDHTWQEIADAGFAVVNPRGMIAIAASIIGNENGGYYDVEFVGARIKEDMSVEWMGIVTTTDSPNGYPVVYNPNSGGGNQS